MKEKQQSKIVEIKVDNYPYQEIIVAAPIHPLQIIQHEILGQPLYTLIAKVPRREREQRKVLKLFILQKGDNFIETDFAMNNSGGTYLNSTVNMGSEETQKGQFSHWVWEID